MISEGFTPSILARFFKLVDVRGVNECWLWLGQRTGRNRKYGRFRVFARKANEKDYGTRMSAHRFVYEFFIGIIPDGYELDHTCETPLCVNPNHLVPVLPHVNKQYRYGARGATVVPPPSDDMEFEDYARTG